MNARIARAIVQRELEKTGNWNWNDIAKKLDINLDQTFSIWECVGILDLRVKRLHELLGPTNDFYTRISADDLSRLWIELDGTGDKDFAISQLTGQTGIPPL
jgi:hypothetical protein